MKLKGITWIWSLFHSCIVTFQVDVLLHIAPCWLL